MSLFGYVKRLFLMSTKIWSKQNPNFYQENERPRYGSSILLTIK